MNLTEFAIKNPDGFIELVGKLRKAGVAKLGALVLGPEPRDHVERDPVDPIAVAHKRHQVMFAASRIAPPFVPPQGSDNGTPRAIVQRRERDGAANGEGRTTR